MTDIGRMLPRGGDSIERAHALESLSAALLNREPQHQRLGRYVLLERLGSGGMGVVFSAYDPQLDRKIALKLLRRTRSDAAVDHGRSEVLREARAMARLSHSHVVTVHEVGEEGERIFLAMEYVTGGTLREWIQAGPRPWRDVARVFAKAGRGLAAAHAADLIHRDFKPENVLMTEAGEPRVADFGLAQIDDSTEVSSEEVTAKADVLLTSGAGGQVGTPGYMAPEVFAGEPANEASDQFSFCVALFEASFGRRPFGGNELDTLRENVEQGRLEEPDAPATVPSALRRVIRRGLSVDPEDRFGSMDALVQALDALLAPPQRGGWWAAGGLALALGGFAAWTGMRADTAGAGDVPCTGGDARAAQVWTPEAGKRLAASLGADATQTARLIERGDIYASTWSDAYREACLDTAVRKVQSERRMEVRMLCLDGNLRTFSGAMRAIGSQRDQDVQTALDIFGRLPDTQLCADPRRVDLETSERDREAVLQIEEELGRARALERFRRPEEAIEIVQTQLTRARTIGDERLIARALLNLAVMEVRSGEPGRARVHIDEARLVAERRGLDRLLIEALILSATDADMRRDGELARREIEVGKAVLQRYGGDSKLEAAIAGRMGTIAYTAGDLDAAVSHYRDQLEALALTGDERSSAGVSALTNLGLALRDQGKNDEALKTLDEARARSTAAFGPENPALPTIDLHIAMVLDELQRYDEALVVLRRGLALSEQTRGSDAAEAIQLHAGFALLHARLGQHEEGLEHSLEAIRILEVLELTEHPDMAMCLGYAGEALAGLDREDEALELQTRALQINEALLGDAHPEVASALIQLAFTQKTLDDLEGAQRSYERALQIRLDAKMPRHAIGDARRILAKHIRDSEPKRAKELARLALADFRASRLNLPDAEAELRELASE